MNKPIAKSLTTPIRTAWLIQLLCFILGIILAILYFIPLDAADRAPWRNSPDVLLPVLIVVAISMGFHHTIKDEGVVVRFFGIPVRLVRWEEVAHAIYIRTINGKKAVVKTVGSGIFISLSGCPQFCPAFEDHVLFRIRHPFNSLFIRLPYDDAAAEPYITLFEYYYPSMRR